MAAAASRHARHEQSDAVLASRRIAGGTCNACPRNTSSCRIAAGAQPAVRRTVAAMIDRRRGHRPGVIYIGTVSGGTVEAGDIAVCYINPTPSCVRAPRSPARAKPLRREDLDGRTQGADHPSRKWRVTAGHPRKAISVTGWTHPRPLADQPLPPRSDRVHRLLEIRKLRHCSLRIAEAINEAVRLFIEATSEK